MLVLDSLKLHLLLFYFGMTCVDDLLKISGWKINYGNVIYFFELENHSL